MVHCEAEEQWAQEGKDLDDERQEEEMRQRTAQAGDAADQRPQPNARYRTRRGLEAARGREFESDSGEVPRNLGEAQPPRAVSRIVDRDDALADGLEDDEVAQVP